MPRLPVNKATTILIPVSPTAAPTEESATIVFSRCAASVYVIGGTQASYRLDALDLRGQETRTTLIIVLDAATEGKDQACHVSSSVALMKMNKSNILHIKAR